ncbi:MAG: DEAD/DEAH box helicase family protein [Fusobacteriaceae bacterium]
MKKIEELIQDFKLPSWLEVRGYQKEAFNFWKAAKGKGILEMATGTGKTITALYIIYELNKIEKTKNEEAIQLRNRITKIETQLRDFSVQKGSLNRMIESQKNDIDKCSRKIKTIESDNVQIKILSERIKFCENLIEKIEEILDLKKKSIRNKLQKKIKEIYDKVTRKGYKIVLNDEFLISIIDPLTNGTVPVSTGEQKIATLCFIGALADVAREIHNKKSDIKDGRIYPIVLDSPFGDLDEEHKMAMSKLLPTLADQIILLASNSQYSDNVKNQIYSKVGKNYVLHNKNPKKDDVKFESTDILTKINEKWRKLDGNNL